jgi:protein TonB
LRDLSCYLSSVSLHAFAIALVTAAAFEPPDFAVTSGGVSIAGSQASVAIDTRVEFSEAPPVDSEATSAAHPFQVALNHTAASASQKKPSLAKVDTPSAPPRPIAATLPRATVEPLLIPDDGLLERIGEESNQNVPVQTAEVDRPEAAATPEAVNSKANPETPAEPLSKTIRQPDQPVKKQPRKASAKSKPVILNQDARRDAETAEPVQDSATSAPLREKREPAETSKTTGPNSAAAPSSNEPAGAKAEQLPRILATNASPAYPLDAWRKQQQGVVYLLVRVSSTGQAASVKLYRSSGFQSLDKAALKTVRGWRFQPALRAGKPVASPVVVPVRFRIQRVDSESN